MSDDKGEIYYGPHLTAAIICLEGGYPENAISWMFRDLAEETGYLPWPIDPASLSVEMFDDSGSPFPNKLCIRYRWLKPEMVGEGI